MHFGCPSDAASRLRRLVLSMLPGSPQLASATRKPLGVLGEI